MLEEQINEAITQLKRYIPKEKEEYLPTKEFVQALESHLAQEEQSYDMLKDFIDPDKEYVPQDAPEAGLYFIEQLHITTKRLKRQANTLKIKIPDNFGFTEEMPADVKNVEVFLKELEIVDRITTLLMEQGVEEISLVKPLSPIEQRDLKTQKLFYRELPIQLSFLCSSSTLVKFLYEVKNFSPVLFMKDIIVKRKDGQSLQVEMLLSRLVI